VQPYSQRAIFLIKNKSIPAFRHKTLLQFVTRPCCNWYRKIGPRERSIIY